MNEIWVVARWCTTGNGYRRLHVALHLSEKRVNGDLASQFGITFGFAG